MAFEIQPRFLAIDPRWFDADSPTLLRLKPLPAPIVRSAVAPDVGDLPSGLPTPAAEGALIVMVASDAEVYYRYSGAAYSEILRIPRLSQLTVAQAVDALEAELRGGSSGTETLKLLRDAISALGTYTATVTSATSITADHGRASTRPPVVVTDEAGRVVNGQVTYTSDTQVVVTFNNPVTGKIEVG